MIAAAYAPRLEIRREQAGNEQIALRCYAAYSARFDDVEAGFLEDGVVLMS
ncbi:hypothetical protein [Mesorhizobium sp. LCM 4576]|uniref:hypothetical protein n=1 Tax=Mesorhizobium sp. LCM 4576 TaxID=1848289 RepID=UPI001FCD1F8F|nr:hypothetical protein [Mesorhizobium sp. LCM 4576]